MTEFYSTNIELYGPTQSVKALVEEMEFTIERWALEYEKFDYIITNFENLRSPRDKEIDLLKDLILTNEGRTCFVSLKEISTSRKTFSDEKMIYLSKKYPDVFIETKSFGDCSGIRDFLFKNNVMLAQRIYDLEEYELRYGTTKLMDVYRLKDLAA
jgi:hypothetical protein